MKYPAALLQSLADAIRPLDTPERRAAYLAGNFPRAALCKDREMRYRWDLMNAIPDYFPRFVNPAYNLGCNDDHIDTALRKVVPKLSPLQS